MLSRGPIPPGLQENINNLAILKALAMLMGQALLIDSTPKIMLLTVDLREDFINVEGIAVTMVLSLQPPSVECTEFDTPKANRLSADGDTAFGE